MVPQDEATVDTVLSAYEEAGSPRRVRHRGARPRRARYRAVHSEGPAGGDPQAAHRAVRPQSQATNSTSSPAQIKRLGLNPTPLPDLGAGAVGAAALLARNCSKASPRCRASMACRCSRMSTRHGPGRGGAGAAIRPSLLDVLAHAGLMNEQLNLVHGVWLHRDDIAQLAEAGARVVHNPISNLKLKSGVAPILDLYRAGVEIALGCDNYSCAETQNIFHRHADAVPVAGGDRPGARIRSMPPMHCSAATLHGARAVGLDGKAGALKPGMTADLSILDLNEPAFVPFNSAARQIVFSESRPRSRDGVRRRPPGGARRQAGHAGRGRACGGGGGDLAGVPARRAGAGQPQQRSDRAAARTPTVTRGRFHSGSSATSDAASRSS